MQFIFMYIGINLAKSTEKIQTLKNKNHPNIYIHTHTHTHYSISYVIKIIGTINTNKKRLLKSMYIC